MLVSLCYVVLGRLLQLALLHVRSNDFKELEIIVLQHELAVLLRRIGRPAMTWPDLARVLASVLANHHGDRLLHRRGHVVATAVRAVLR